MSFSVLISNILYSSECN